MQEGEAIICEQKTISINILVFYIKKICFEGLLQTHGYTYGLVKLSDSKAKQNKKDLIVRKKLLGGGLKGWFIYAYMHN